MKTLFAITCFMVLIASTTFAAENPAAVESARIGGNRQVEIQAEAQKLIADLNMMVDEYERNGLGGDDIKNLKNLQKVLSGLSGQKMEKIVTLLREASLKGDSTTAVKAISDAYAQQKGVLAKLNDLLAIYEKEREALELSNAVKQLADRQATNLQNGIEVARWSLGDSKDKASAIEASLNGQSAEQKAISDELKLLEPKIDDFAKKPGDPVIAERFKNGMKEIVTIKPALETASSSLDDKKLFDAVASEKSARDQLRHLARTISPPKDPMAALREALEQIEKLIAQQNEMIIGTDEAVIKPIDVYVSDSLKQAVPDKRKKRVGDTNFLIGVLRKDKLMDVPVDKLIGMDVVKRVYDTYKRDRDERSVGLENQEGDLTNQSDGLSHDLEAIAKPASDLLKQAIPPMQSVRIALVKKAPSNALKPEKDALDFMQKAREELERQMDEMKKADKDPIAAMKELQQETQKVLEQQKELAKQTAEQKNPQQAADNKQKEQAIEKKTEELQKQASDKAPDAAQSLDNAAKNMDEAAKDMNTPQNQQALAHQDQAIKALEKANEQMGQQIATMEQTQQNLATEGQVLEELQKIIEAEEKLKADTAQVAPKRKKEEIEPLAPRQQEIQKDTQLLKNSPNVHFFPEDLPKVVSAISHMGNAQNALKIGDGFLADSEEKKALEDLYKIKAALQQMQAAATAAAQAAQAAAQAAQDPTAMAQAQAGIKSDKHDGPPQPGEPTNGEPDDKGNQAISNGVQGADAKTAAIKKLFLTLPKRDRGPLQQSQSEKYPQQYAAKVEQYLQNLAEETGPKK